MRFVTADGKEFTSREQAAANAAKLPPKPPSLEEAAAAVGARLDQAEADRRAKLSQVRALVAAALLVGGMDYAEAMRAGEEFGLRHSLALSAYERTASKAILEDVAQDDQAVWLERPCSYPAAKIIRDLFPLILT